MNSKILNWIYIFAVLIAIMLITICARPADAAGYELNMDYYRDNTIATCKAAFKNTRSNELFCIMSEFYAMQKFDDIMNGLQSEAELNELMECAGPFYIKKFDTFVFSVVIDKCPR